MGQTAASDLGQGLVRENWGDQYIIPFYEQNRVLPYASNVSGDCKKGDTLNVPVAPVLTVGTPNATTGALNIQTVAHTNVAVLVDRPRDVTVDMLGVAEQQADSKFENEFPLMAGDAMQEEMETALLALQSDLTTTAVGSTTGDIGEDELIAAIQAAITAKLPILKNPQDFCLALADNAWAPLRKLKIFDYNSSGVAGENAAKKLDLPAYGGIPVRFSTQVAASAGARKSMLFHKSAFAWAAQKNPATDKASRLAAGQWSTLMTCIGLYGVKTVSATRGWVINSKA
jgi:hypothetical protein